MNNKKIALKNQSDLIVKKELVFFLCLYNSNCACCESKKSNCGNYNAAAC